MDREAQMKEVLTNYLNAPEEVKNKVDKGVLERVANEYLTLINDNDEASATKQESPSNKPYKPKVYKKRDSQAINTEGSEQAESKPTEVANSMNPFISL